MILPQRKVLPHATPSALRGYPMFFVTVCGVPRGENQFCVPEAAQAIFGASEFYVRQLRWWPNLLLLMPDHLHMLVSFPKEESMKRVVSAWKHYLAKQCGLKWQRDFFDHRLRDDESWEEKARYIRQNPVRAGLVPRAEAWAYVWSADADRR